MQNKTKNLVQNVWTQLWIKMCKSDLKWFEIWTHQKTFLYYIYNSCYNLICIKIVNRNCLYWELLRFMIQNFK